ncbi:sensor histidine kinase, partial [Bacillus paranthracis]|nr:sensor histidine kinase [Bacillus paranthracis]
MIRLFIRDHIPLICFTVIQLLSIFLVYWFDGHKHIATALYAMFLGAFFMVGYLVLRYFT